ncbi:hypothetical protein DV738_g610, partial [Chaetothyriales sp. CBS 135597]
MEMFSKPASRHQQQQHARLYAAKAEQPNYQAHTSSSFPAFAGAGPQRTGDGFVFVMADGRNEARAMRVLEIMNDFRTVQHHLESLIARQESVAPDQESSYLNGYVLLRQCETESRAVMAANFNPGAYGINTGGVPETEVHKAELQRSQAKQAQNHLGRIEPPVSITQDLPESVCGNAMGAYAQSSAQRQQSQRQDRGVAQDRSNSS